MCFTAILLNTSKIRKLNSTAVDQFFFLKITRRETTGLCAITAPSYKQPNKLSQPQNTPLNYFTCSDFPCHFKVNRDQLALTNRRWKCTETEQRLTITASSVTKIDQHDNFTRFVSRRHRDCGQRWENPIRFQDSSL